MPPRWKAADGRNSQAPKFWLRQEGTQRFMKSLEKKLKVTEDHLLETASGFGGGTWGHYQIALAYANNIPVTDSLKVAEYFGKQHKHVLEAIRVLIEGGVPNFRLTPYVHHQNGQEYEMYEMNRNPWMILVMGFTGEKALQFKQDFVDAFDKMEATIRNQAGEIQRLTTVCERLEAAVSRLEAPFQAMGAREDGLHLRDSFRAGKGDENLYPPWLYYGLYHGHSRVELAA